MKVYAIRNKNTGKLIKPDSYRNSTPKFYSNIRFAKCAMTCHGMKPENFEIVEFELTNEKIVN